MSWRLLTLLLFQKGFSKQPMDLSMIWAYVPVVFRELLLHKFKVFACFAIVSLAVLIVGNSVKSTFTTSATIFADNQNILKPLLAQKAAITGIQEHIRVVREAISAPSLLRAVVESEYDLSVLGSAAEVDRLTSSIRKRLKVQGLGSNYVKISYSDSTPDKAFDILNSVIDRFIKESSESRRVESREAFQFIDNQVKQYKDQLLSAEEQLKRFKAENFDGREADVDASISSLRTQLEEMKINIDEQRSRVAIIQKQLGEENREVAKRYKSDVYRDRIAELKGRVDNLLLTYQESYPDVINLRLQIKDTEAALREAQESEMAQAFVGDSSDVVVNNPYYDALRAKQSEAEINLNTLLRRQSATEKRLADEFERRKRIAAQQAELAELTRDYNVTKGIYDDMLERKEKARLSMTLSIEGQGVNYKMQEPPEYPLNPEGVRFLHFVLAGPFLGLLLPIGVLIAYVVLDYRIRFPYEVTGITDVPILAVVPHIHTPLARRLAKTDMLLLAFMSVGLMVVYIGLAYSLRAGVFSVGS